MKETEIDAYERAGSKMLTKVEEVYLDILDLIHSGQIDDFEISGFKEFFTLRHFLIEQNGKLVKILLGKLPT